MIRQFINDPSRVAVAALCLVLTITAVWNFPSNILCWDVFGYYLYLPMTFIYDNLDLSNRDVIDQILATYNNSATFYQAFEAPSGNWVMRYTMGMSILYAPFFFIGHLAAQLFGYPADGFSWPYQLAIWMGSLFYTFLGIIFLRKVLLKFVDPKITAWVLVMVVLGTNYALHSNMSGQGAMSHNYIFSLYAVMLWCTIRWHETFRWKYVLVLGVCTGITIIARPSELVWLLIPLLWGIHNWSSLLAKFALAFKNFRQIMAFGAIVTLIGLLQVWYWKTQTGEYLFDSYKNPGEGVDFPPHTLNTLFSFRNGWLIYTPIMGLALLGFWTLKKRHPEYFLPILAYFIANLWIVSGWTVWWLGDCFSHRGLIVSYTVLSIPLALWIRERFHSEKVKVWLVRSLVTFLVILNLFQIWQYMNMILPTARTTFKYYMAAFGKTSVPGDALKHLMREWPVTEEMEMNDPELHAPGASWQVGFEPEEKLWTPSDTTHAHTGIASLYFDENREFGPTIEKKLRSVTGSYYGWIRMSVWIWPVTHPDSLRGALVGSIDHKGQPYKYRTKFTRGLGMKKDQWNLLQFDMLTPSAIRSPNDTLKVYFWNIDKGKYYVDDLKVQVFEPIYDPTQ